MAGADNPGDRGETGKTRKSGSGGTGGRTRKPQEFRDIVRGNTVKAIKRLVAIIDDAEAKDTDAIRACEFIIDRAYGKAAQPIVGDQEHDPVQFDITNPEQRRALIDEYFRTTGAASDTV